MSFLVQFFKRLHPALFLGAGRRGPFEGGYLLLSHDPHHFSIPITAYHALQYSAFTASLKCYLGRNMEIEECFYSMTFGVVDQGRDVGL